jgi:hypothetical protein
VSGPLARAGALFLSPRAAAPRAAALPRADLVGVLAAPRDLPAVAGAIAAELRQRQRGRAALVCRPGPLLPAPAVPAAHALARRLSARDLPAVAAGALCQVTLGDGADAPREAWRAIAAAAGHPAVVAAPGRDAEWDALLAEADQLVLAPPPDAPAAYVEAARASLAALGPPVELVAPPAGVVARRAAALGLLRLRPSPVEAPA